MIKSEELPIIFTPNNEPYLGRTLLLNFDKIIISAMEQNASIAPKSHKIKLTDIQAMACQVVPQALSIMLSIRELIRQGYLFSGHVLYRPFVERVTILLYLHYYPAEINLWKGGWDHDKAPSLAKMLKKISKAHGKSKDIVKGYKLTADMNSLLHGKPNSARWNLVLMETNKLGHASSKILNRPDLCDDLCVDMILYVFILQAMMAFYFPATENGWHG